MRRCLTLLILTAVLLVGGAAIAQSSAPASGGVSGAAAGSDVLYQDDSAQSSATITQILPNSNTSMMTLQTVRRIRVQQEIIVVEWGTTATTLLPRQFVGSMTVNKRTDAGGK